MKSDEQEITPLPEVKKELLGMDKRIEDARKFNSQLPIKKAKPIPTPIPIPEVINELRDDKLEIIKIILKRYGMDSQQQIKALADIKLTLGW